MSAKDAQDMDVPGIDAPETDGPEMDAREMASSKKGALKKRAPRKRRRWILWAVLAVAVVAVVIIAMQILGGGQSGGAANYTTAKVAREDLRVTVSGSGNTVVGSATRVDPGITGTVTDLSVKLGETVKAGEVLFRVTNPDLDAAVERAEVSYKQAKQQLAQARGSLIQAQNALYNAQHPSAVGTGTPKPVNARDVKAAKQQVTVANLGVSTACESLDSASTALAQAQDTANQRTVTAPVSGLITVLNAQNGQSLTGGGSQSNASSASGGSSSSGAAEISDLATLRASVAINEVDLVNVKTGQKATVQFDALPSVSVSGTVSAISPTGTNQSGVVTYQVDITLASIDPRLRPTMSCSAEIETAVKPGALVVPSSAIKTTSGKTYVQVFDIGATAPRQVAVTTGAIVGTNTEITTGLTEGQYVVTGTATGTSTGTTGAGGGGGVFRIFGGGRG
jgi:RND family efflux transporter MFP subunit